MANKSAVLYQYVKVCNKGKHISGGRTSQAFLSKGYFCLSWCEGAVKQWENVGADPQKVTEALEKKRLQLAFVAAGGEVKDSRLEELRSPEPFNMQVASIRTKLREAVSKYQERCRTRQGKSGYGMASRSVEAHEYRLGFLLEFHPPAEKEEKDRDVFLDEIDKDFLYGFLAFLRQHKNNLSDRTCYNIMQPVSTLLIHYEIRTATGIPESRLSLRVGL